MIFMFRYIYDGWREIEKIPVWMKGVANFTVLLE